MVRLANRWDRDNLVNMFCRYRSSSKIQQIVNSTNTAAAERIIEQIIIGHGIALISEIKEQPTGMLIALRHPLVWDPDLVILSEIAWWVDQEYRGSRSGLLLLKEYQRLAEQEISQGKIINYTISEMVDNPIDYSRWGLKPRETIWTK
jgi:hypothetical protein